jgi:hypothetical protein
VQWPAVLVGPHDFDQVLFGDGVARSTTQDDLGKAVEGQKLQAVDQVHLNKDGKIDQLIIYTRPIPATPEVCGSHQSKTSAYEVGSSTIQ